MSIYERQRKRASDADGRITRAATGAVVATALLLMAVELGIPQIAGIGRYNLIFAFAAAGAVLGLTRLRRVMVWLTAFLILLFAVVGWTDVVRAPALKLVRADPVPPSADAIVVLSSGVTADGMLNQQSLDRLLKGVELSKAGVAPRLVVTRERRRSGGGYITSMEDQGRIIALVPGTEVIATGLVASTREEALRVSEHAKRGAWKRIVLITSPFHSRRACATFEKVGLVVSCVPSDSRDIAVRSIRNPRDRVGAFSMWIYELAGTARYWQAGWI